MTTPASAIGLAAVQAEFGGANPIGLNEYYRGGSLVPAGTAAGTSGVQIATSGAISLGDFRAVSAAAPVNPLPLLQLDEFQNAGPASCGFEFTTAGTVVVTGLGSTQSGSQWFNPTTGGIGSSYWVKVSITSGSNPTTSPGLGVWLPLTSNRYWAWSRTILGSVFAGFTVSISNNGTDGGIVATRAGNTAVAEWA